MSRMKNRFNSLTIFVSATMSPSFTNAQNAPVMPPQGTVPAEKTSESYTLWKASMMDIVLATKNCSDGLCGYIYWLNPKDKSIYEAFSTAKANGDAIITDDDVKSFCGYRPKAQFKEVSPSHWVGTLELPGKNTKVKIDAETKDGRTMNVKVSQGFFSKKEIWYQIKEGDARYPKCTLPKLQ